MAPEVIHPRSSSTSSSLQQAEGDAFMEGGVYDESGMVSGAPADIWSLGCTVIEMGTAKAPWAEQSKEITALMFMVRRKGGQGVI